MISTKKLIKMARKWKKLAAASRRRISGPATTMANKGHFVIYTTDDGRFMIPLLYLKSETMRELLRMAEEEFGLISEGPITLPCDSTSMEYVLSILQQHASENLEKAIILSLKSCCSSLLSSTLQHDHRNQQLLISSF